ncbi:phosphoribosylformylglycinamidine cyclo-ligase [Acidobacteriota bacterium]
MGGLTYKQAGVDIDRADEFIRKIKPLIRKTGRPEVLSGLGGFGGLFQPRLKGLKNPVLVSSTDGVGTKLLVAEKLNRFDTVGIDLVAMCVNDVLAVGAEPLFFLDYIAIGKLDVKKLHDVMKGISNGCVQAGCALIGGETAELPGMYTGEDFDLAGFCVGLVDKNSIIDGRFVKPGDRIVGLASSGLHSNGFSLVRKVFSNRELVGKLGKDILKPTRIYVQPVLQVLKKLTIKAVAHITGGGFYDNIPRVLPSGCSVRVSLGTWPVPSLFKKIQEKGRIDSREMYRTLNMGIGMVLIFGPRSADRAVSLFKSAGVEAYVIGEVTRGDRTVEISG